MAWSDHEPSWVITPLPGFCSSAAPHFLWARSRMEWPSRGTATGRAGPTRPCGPCLPWVWGLLRQGQGHGAEREQPWWHWRPWLSWDWKPSLRCPCGQGMGHPVPRFRAVLVLHEHRVFSEVWVKSGSHRTLSKPGWQTPNQACFAPIRAFRGQGGWASLTAAPSSWGFSLQSRR